MSKVRKDGKGRVLHKGETYLRNRKLYSFSYTDALGKRRFLYSGDLNDLREKEEKFLKKRLDKLDVYLLAKADVNYVFDRYISMKKNLRNSTLTNYNYTYDRYVRKGFGKKKIEEVRFSDVMMFYLGLLDRGLSVSIVDSVNSVLHPTFQLAIRDNVLNVNPVAGVMAEVRRNIKDKQEARHALSIDEQRVFMECLDKPEYERWRILFTVLFGTGCRIGEVIGLRWCDISLKEGTININHSLTYGPVFDKGYKCEYQISLPKTQAGIRVIPMLDKVKEAFLAEKRRQDEWKFVPEIEINGMSGFIFRNRYGLIYKPSCINKTIKRIVDEYNADEEIKARREQRDPLFLPRFSCHITRHSFCSRLCENETNIKVIQSVMGHKDIQTTLDIYAEVSESKKKEVFKELNNNNIF